MVLSKTQRIAGLSVAVAALILFFVFRPSPLPVDSGVVRRGPLQVTLEGEGVTRVNDRYVVAAPVSGKLVRVELEEGDSVRKGNVVAALLPPELDTREYREASSRAGSARAALDEAIARQRRVMLTLAQAERRSVVTGISTGKELFQRRHMNLQRTRLRRCGKRAKLPVQGLRLPALTLGRFRHLLTGR